MARAGGAALAAPLRSSAGMLLPALLLASTVSPVAAACVADRRNDTFWDHTKCSSGSGTNACCATVWSPRNEAECCLNCESSAFGFDCVAWEWDSAGAACYVCSKEVLSHRGRKAGHTTGRLNLSATALAPPAPHTIDQIFPPPPDGWKTPSWQPTYNTPDSTLLQACDYRWDMSRDSDWNTVLRKFGIVDIESVSWMKSHDEIKGKVTRLTRCCGPLSGHQLSAVARDSWVYSERWLAIAKEQWINEKVNGTMGCEEAMQDQAALIKQGQTADRKVWICECGWTLSPPPLLLTPALAILLSISGIIHEFACMRCCQTATLSSPTRG